tara:strand:- start:1442 stop:1681 length:240 start_codon:yes stop_codon:yes gene_type:complete
MWALWAGVSPVVASGHMLKMFNVLFGLLVLTSLRPISLSPSNIGKTDALGGGDKYLNPLEKPKEFLRALPVARGGIKGA